MPSTPIGSTPIAAHSRIRFGKLSSRHLLAEMFRAQSEQLDERTRGTVGVHQLLRAHEGQRCLELAVDFREKQQTAWSWPVVEGGKPGDRLVVLAGCEPQRDAGGWAWCAARVGAFARAESEQSQPHPFSTGIAAARPPRQASICSGRYK